MARHSARVQEETIPDDLLANIPFVEGDRTTTFDIEAEEVIAAPGGFPTPGSAGAPLGAALAHQLRYDLGEALARELDRASDSFAAAISDLESRLAEAQAGLRSTHEALDKERSAREVAEHRLAAFKDLALK